MARVRNSEETSVARTVTGKVGGGEVQEVEGGHGEDLDLYSE